IKLAALGIAQASLALLSLAQIFGTRVERMNTPETKTCLSPALSWELVAPCIKLAALGIAQASLALLSLAQFFGAHVERMNTPRNENMPLACPVR
ncbi:MAG: hypothetical protein SPK03_07130, partial [Alloprevotella sp.]|nr:hypothetical protein [Alloprevotella sp.]